MTVKSWSFCNKECERKKWTILYLSIYLSNNSIFISGQNLQFLYNIWKSRFLGSCRSCPLNVSISYFPICKIEVVKLILSVWVDQTENTSGQRPSFTIEEYHTGKVIKKYPSKLFLIENCVYKRGYGHTNQLWDIVKEIMWNLPNIPLRLSSMWLHNVR